MSVYTELGLPTVPGDIKTISDGSMWIVNDAGDGWERYEYPVVVKGPWTPVLSDNPIQSKIDSFNATITDTASNLKSSMTNVATGSFVSVSSNNDILVVDSTFRGYYFELPDGVVNQNAAINAGCYVIYTDGDVSGSNPDLPATNGIGAHFLKQGVDSWQIRIFDFFGGTGGLVVGLTDSQILGINFCLTAKLDDPTNATVSLYSGTNPAASPISTYTFDYTTDSDISLANIISHYGFSDGIEDFEVTSIFTPQVEFNSVNRYLIGKVIDAASYPDATERESATYMLTGILLDGYVESELGAVADGYLFSFNENGTPASKTVDQTQTFDIESDYNPLGDWEFSGTVTYEGRELTSISTDFIRVDATNGDYVALEGKKYLNTTSSAVEQDFIIPDSITTIDDFELHLMDGRSDTYANDGFTIRSVDSADLYVNGINVGSTYKPIIGEDAKIVFSSSVNRYNLITHSTGQVNTVSSGTNITIDNTDPVNPIVNLNAAITGTTVDGVTLTTAGLITNYLNASGSYSAPPAGQVDSVVGGADITIDNTDPVNPIVNYVGSSANSIRAYSVDFDETDAGTFNAGSSLPIGAIVTGCKVLIESGFDGTTTTIDIGNLTSASALMSSIENSPLIPGLYSKDNYKKIAVANDQQIFATLTLGDSTTGSGSILFEYYIAS